MQILNMEAFPKKQNVGYTGTFFLFPKTADKIVCGSAHLLNTPMHPKMYPACNSASSREHPAPQMCPKCNAASSGEHTPPILCPNGHFSITGEHPAPQMYPKCHTATSGERPAPQMCPKCHTATSGEHPAPTVCPDRRQKSVGKKMGTGRIAFCQNDKYSFWHSFCPITDVATLREDFFSAATEKPDYKTEKLYNYEH